MQGFVCLFLMMCNGLSSVIIEMQVQVAIIQFVSLFLSFLESVVILLHLHISFILCFKGVNIQVLVASFLEGDGVKFMKTNLVGRFLD